MWLTDSGLWVTGLWAWGFNTETCSIWFHPFFWALCLILTLNFSQSRALSFISPENKPLPFSRERKGSYLVRLVEDLVGSECSENWLFSNFLVLSCERRIHFSLVLFVSKPQARLCKTNWLASQSCPTFHSTLPDQLHSSAGLPFSTNGVSLISCFGPSLVLWFTPFCFCF